jgi:hypothetical protein
MPAFPDSNTNHQFFYYTAYLLAFSLKIYQTLARCRAQ